MENWKCAILQSILTVSSSNSGRHFLFANASASFNNLVSSYPGPLAMVSILVSTRTKVMNLGGASFFIDFQSLFLFLLLIWQNFDRYPTTSTNAVSRSSFQEEASQEKGCSKTIGELHSRQFNAWRKGSFSTLWYIMSGMQRLFASCSFLHIKNHIPLMRFSMLSTDCRYLRLLLLYPEITYIRAGIRAVGCAWSGCRHEKPVRWEARSASTRGLRWPEHVVRWWWMVGEEPDGY